ncbi:MAG: transposase [Burkholderiales bacterium]
MPRLPRVMSAGFPQHVVQRGNNREACFFSEADYAAYLHWLERAARTYQVAIHAYVLMSNHVHLLATPGIEGGISRMMQYLGRHYVQYVNRTHCRSGTLWERRFRAHLVESECYLLTLYRYIERNPVRAGVVTAPDQYPWSSARAHLARDESALIVDHEAFLCLGETPETRALAYDTLVREPLNDGMLSQIRAAANRGMVLGSERFKDQLEIQLGRRVRLGRPGRKPRLTSAHQG